MLPQVVALVTRTVKGLLESRWGGVTSGSEVLCGAGHTWKYVTRDFPNRRVSKGSKVYAGCTQGTAQN